MILKKLRSKRGETLVEMLVSIALLVMAMSILSAMLAAAYRLDESARSEDENFSFELYAAELQNGNIGDATVTISGSSDSASIDVNVYGVSDGKLRSYKLASSTP